MPDHPPYYAMSFEEICERAERREIIVSTCGYLICSRDRKFDPKYARYIWEGERDNAIFTGRLPPDVNKPNITQKTIPGAPDDPLNIQKDARPTNAKGKPLTWSYTALTDFEGCPKRYAHSRFYCDKPFVETEAIIWGNRVHENCELSLKGKPAKETEIIKPLEKYLQLFKQAKAEAELEIALTEDMQPVSWFAKMAWFRCKLDVVVIKGQQGNYYDWKTGSKIKDDVDQLKIGCSTLAIVRPELENFTGKLIWTKHDTVTGGCDMTRADTQDFWSKTLGRVDRLRRAWETETFPARSSGLCPWCAAYSECPYAKKR